LPATASFQTLALAKARQAGAWNPTAPLSACERSTARAQPVHVRLDRRQTGQEIYKRQQEFARLPWRRSQWRCGQVLHWSLLHLAVRKDLGDQSDVREPRDCVLGRYHVAAQRNPDCLKFVGVQLGAKDRRPYCEEQHIPLSRVTDREGVRLVVADSRDAAATGARKFVGVVCS